MSIINQPLTILYRGPLASCNYDCHYCPFGKQKDSRKELILDQQALERFTSWCELSDRSKLSILFTPWGEALTRKWYWVAIQRLSSLSYVRRVAIQTNLSCNLSWLDKCDVEKIGLWCTFHPEEADLNKFVLQCQTLTSLGVRYSVGIVGIKENFESISSLRKVLPESTYVWVNAYKSVQQYYDNSEIEFLKSVDPYFEINNQRHASKGENCATGESVISIDGNGNVFRCHFVKQRLGNIYETTLSNILKPRTCPNQSCGCHIGYVHLSKLNLGSVFGDGLLERIPAKFDRAVDRQQSPIKS